MYTYSKRLKTNMLPRHLKFILSLAFLLCRVSMPKDKGQNNRVFRWRDRDLSPLQISVSWHRRQLRFPNTITITFLLLLPWAIPHFVNKQSGIIISCLRCENALEKSCSSSLYTSFLRVATDARVHHTACTHAQQSADSCMDSPSKCVLILVSTRKDSSEV